MPRNEKAIATLETSDKPRELARAAQTLAASVNPEDHVFLLRLLRNPAFRERLDPPDAEVAGADDLYLARPIRTLAANRAQVARESLRQLINDRAFNEDPDRVDLLLRATATWRPAEPDVVAFWRRVMDPDGVHAEIAVTVAVENASEPAVAFFEECLRNTRFDEDLRVAWMRRPLLLHRTEEPFLRMCERLLLGGAAGTHSPALQRALVEALFDFKQEEWYPPHNPPVPPKRALTNRAGRDILRRIAAHARENLEPGPELEVAIAAVLKRFDAMDKAHAP
jgi:hypothetical protein